MGLNMTLAPPTLPGSFPIREGPVRFTIETPSGMTSNAWRVWTRKRSVYIACRDSMKDIKVSLHAGGRWRMGFTEEAANRLLPKGQNRAWEVWDEPPAQFPGAIKAFKLIFPLSELAVRPDQRKPSEWEDVVHIEAAPPSKLTVATLFVTMGDIGLRHESEPSFCLASLDIGGGRRAQLIIHDDPEGATKENIDRDVAAIRRQAEAAGKVVPEAAYAYLFGHGDDGVRFLVGARMTRP